VILGVSGGLNPALGAGQGYLVERVQAVDLENPIAGHSVTFLSSSEPCFDAIRKRLALPYGLHLSASRIICDVDTKRRLFAQTDALGVDLETFEIAALCQARRIPWLALRMVSDAATESLPRSLQGFVDYQERPLMYFKNIGKTALEAGFKQMIDLHRRVVNCSIKLEGYLRGACEVFLLDKKG
jgi:nucleoside phosphorylase